MVPSDLNSLKPNLIVLHLMKMVLHMVVVLMVVCMFLTKNKIWVLFLRHMLVKSLLLYAHKESLSQQVKMICSLSFQLIKENINSSDKLLLNNSTLHLQLISQMERFWLDMITEKFKLSMKMEVIRKSFKLLTVMVNHGVLKLFRIKEHS